MKLADYTPEIPRYHSQVLDRVVAILACYSEGRSELTFTEFLQETALSKSTLYRLLQVLEQHRFLERKDGGIYSLGLKIFELGSIAFASMNLQRLTTPHLEKLVDVTGETAHLGVLDGSEVVFIAKAESPHPVRIPSGVGFRSPAYCTGVGKALLCGLSEADLNTYLSRSPLERLTDRTIVSPERFKEELRVTRDRGYSLNLGELTEDIRCVGGQFMTIPAESWRRSVLRHPHTDSSGKTFCALPIWSRRPPPKSPGNLVSKVMPNYPERRLTGRSRELPAPTCKPFLGHPPRHSRRSILGKFDPKHVSWPTWSSLTRIPWPKE